MERCKIKNCTGLGKLMKNGYRWFQEGYCRNHYRKFQLYGNPLLKKEYNSPTSCKVNGCSNMGVKYKNGNYYFVKGYCGSHYRKYLLYGDPTINKQIAKTVCSIEGCDNPKHQKIVKGMCVFHYYEKKIFNEDNPRKKLRGYNVDTHVLYPTYCAMKGRCFNPKNPNYKNYGARGIKICERWLGIYGFLNFIEDMGDRPLEMGKNRMVYSLDRIDVNGNYCPENCRWATANQQQSNRRNNNDIVGVRFDKSRNRWMGFLENDRVLHLKFFFLKEEAIKYRKYLEEKYLK